ncbi:putative F-box/kelch-repeat protein At2g29810 [Corylus avellana]|uniref:putative F-box/kelch-repeat protein At2g29810 n=1 Tax=Corylus avellana TaxID=13451 RepID=UPI00286CDA01|nr:putative F-box/kelch-repeat protein At2g29810 [Corylus avellana]
MAKEWVRVSPPMISKRCNTAASVLGGKIYVRNHSPSHHTADSWSEVFDPVNRKWETLPNPPSYHHDCLIIYAVLENPDRIIVAFRVPKDTYSAIFYEYSVHDRSWKELAPARRKLHPMCRRGWLERPLSVSNTLYWVEHKHDVNILIAYDLKLDVWLEGRVEGLESSCLPDCEVTGGPGLPSLVHLERERFCVLECRLDDYLHCMAIDVSRMNDGTLGISVAWSINIRWNQSYAREYPMC